VAAVAEWHLKAIRVALEARGSVIAEHSGDDYRIAGTWEQRRPGDDRVLWIDFDGLDDMRTLSYGCQLRGTRATSPGLYFRRARAGDTWKRELAAFVAVVETYGTAGHDEVSQQARVDLARVTSAGASPRSRRRSR
jgi:hypothetical protein